ncbi:DASS family sodium-coupled anion symporter [Dongshaea marina]|uniref:DASS family sodium-coupled anion symporter n=1 Tax=Dongshaea marina TaxID=2047966 RepID=UPI000D3E08B9|nr:DASS family sodium-coupled anion symporter [Dongshaea marina]
MSQTPKRSGAKLLPLTIIVIVAAIFWYQTPPEGLQVAAWHTAIVFVGTIVAIVANVMPVGAVGLLGITVFALTHAGGEATGKEAIVDALSDINNYLIWLIVVAFLIARGFIKTGLGRRIALLLTRVLGKRTLGLAYGLALADLILAPAMPSNTARCGGVIYPVADSLARSFDSKPGDGTAKKIGTFLICCIGNVNDITAAMFLTAYTGNLLAAKLAADAGISLGWGYWFMAAVVPCLVALLLIPLVVYFLTKPEIKRTPDAPRLAKQQLAEMGRMSRNEWIMLGVFLLLLVLWIFGGQFGIHSTEAAFIGLCVLLITGVLDWDDVKSEKGAWDTLIWFAALLMMANMLKQLGFTAWFGGQVGGMVQSYFGGMSWVVVLAVLVCVYFYTHYFFASGTAQVAALYSVFLSVGIQLGVPAVVMAMMLASASSLYCSLTQYTHARGPILFGSGYISTGTWWSVGLVVSIINQLIFLSVGLLWWKLIGLY